MNKFSIQTSFAISAGAGSGKTYTLSRRFINILLGFDFFIEKSEQLHHYESRLDKAADLREIVTITYTEAAALEMKERIFGLIHKILHIETLSSDDGDFKSIQLAFEGLELSAKGYVNERLEKAIREMGEASITTIHGFCLGILKRHADVAKIDGALDVYGDEDKKQLFQNVYFEVINNLDHHDDILAITEHVSLYKSRTLVERYVFEHKFRMAFDRYVHGNHENLKTLLRNTFLEPLSDLIDEAREELKGDSKLPALQRFIEKAYNFEFESFNESADFCSVSKTLGAKKFPFTTELRDAIQGLNGYFSVIDEERESQFVTIIERFRKLLGLIKSRYDEEMKIKGVTDFDTIIQRAGEIITKVDSGYKYLMVDEFQDTNAIQWDIVKSAAKNANLFVVGDEKQSIYAFQGGEIEVFHGAIKEKFNDAPESMKENYRSDTSIIDFVNKVFKSIFTRTDTSGQNRLIQNDYEASHQDLDSMSKNEGSVAFLVSRIDKSDEEGEAEATNLALFIKNIVEGDIYSDISTLIRNNQPAITVVYDAKSKMLSLKEALYNLGIECKVSASENFYAKEEICDIFFVLKALSILRKNPSLGELSKKDRYHLAGALRSKIIRMSDKELHHFFRKGEGEIGMEKWFEQSYRLSVHELIQTILLETDSYTAFAQSGNYDQRLANIQSLFSDIIAYEKTHGYDFDGYLYQLEQQIFHAQSDEEEAFYRSTTAGSIELCSIHSTKGLAYPMVIVADSAKSLISQVTTESIKFNSFKDTMGDKHNLIGFKVGDYEPLSMRLLKEIDKRKHLAEKKRLFYVALTRPQNHLVISAGLKATKDGVGSISNSYLQMTLDAIGLSKEDLYNKSIQNSPYQLFYNEDLTTYESAVIQKSYEKIQSLAPITFYAKTSMSATGNNTCIAIEEKDPELERSAVRGTLVHKSLELFWDRLDDDALFDALFIKEGIDDLSLQADTKTLARNFINTDVYSVLQSGAEHIFEFSFDEDIEGQRMRGSIDMIYKDPTSSQWIIIDFKSGKERVNHDYQDQLDFYKKVLEYKNIPVLDAKLCWLG